jgi:hypothetical protein
VAERIPDRKFPEPKLREFLDALAALIAHDLMSEGRGAKSEADGMFGTLDDTENHASMLIQREDASC